jgi:hypothetical protein
VFFIGGALALFAWRAPLLKQGGLFAPISREGALVLNNLFLTTACATVFVGTLYPLALEALTGDKISVGRRSSIRPSGRLFIPLMLVMPFGPLLGGSAARHRRAHHDPAHAVQCALRRADRDAALGLGHGLRAFRHRRDAARHRRRHRLGQRADRGIKPGESHRHFALPADLRRRVRTGRDRIITMSSATSPCVAPAAN